MQPLKILYLAPDLFGPPGGIARHGRTVCQALLERDTKLTTLALLDKSSLPNIDQPILSKMDYQACNGNRKIFIRKALQAARNSPDLVLLEHPNFSPLGWVAAKIAHAPLVVIAHGIDVWEPLPFLRKWTINRANRVWCVSGFTAHRLAEVNGVKASNTRVLHNCLEPGFTPLPMSENRKNRRRSLLTVARLSKSEGYKGHDYVIRSMPQLLKEFPDLIYDIVGDGDGKLDLETLAQQQGVSHAVNFHGRVSEKELANRYDEATLFVMPSRGEGFGIAFLEAMVHGIPVVGGNVDASPEVIEDGVTGFTVDPTSVEAVTAAISKILHDPQMAQQMSVAGKSRATKTFGYHNFREKLWQYLDEVVL